MPPLPERVEPGDLITSELINELLAMIRDMDTQIDVLAGTIGGNVPVPNLFGRTLLTARSTLTQPTINLRVGTVLDATGNVIDPDLAAEQHRLVISQAPAAGMRVSARAAVNMVVAAESLAGNGSPGPGQDPVILGFVPEPAFIGETVAILGQNFDATRTRNTVTFDGVPAGEPQIGSSVDTLVVSVPVIPDAPSGEQVVVATVVVSIPGRIPATGEVSIRASRENRPQITSILNASGNAVNAGGVVTVEEEIHIVGANFADDPSAITISFGESDVEANSSSDTDLFVTVPRLPGHSQSTPLVAAALVITVERNEPDGSQQSEPFNLQVFLSP
jgi:hypothetical protein